MKARDTFEAALDVSRETMDRLDSYEVLLTNWNKAINLVARSTIPGLWQRHFLDSAQVFVQLPESTRVLVDMGSGAGLPGLVIAVLAAEAQPNLKVVCIESDQRKAVFLRTVIRELDLNASVITNRIENIDPIGADVVAARALAPLPTLLSLATRHLRPDGAAIFLKGSGYLQEVGQAESEWVFDIQTIPSKTDSEGAVLILGGIRRA